ncbi:translocation/assembly module TamB domain-containing protein [Acetohalobium arabaticum]|nr:translocation/assembly module TamB domain-containing protein [Acetohalobium arabaticum]
MPVARKYRRIIPWVVILILGASLFMTMSLKWDGVLTSIKDRLVMELESRYGYNVNLDKIEISGVNELKLYNFSLELKEDGFLSVEQVELSYDLLDIVAGKTDSLGSIKEIKLVSPRLIYKQTSNDQADDGTDNLQDLFGSAPILNHYSGRIAIEDGMAVTNLIDGISKIRINQAGLNLTKDNLKGRLDLTLPETETENLVVNGSTDENQFKLTTELDNLDLNVLSEEWKEVLTQKGFQLTAGKASGNLEIKGGLGFESFSELDYKGEIRLKEGIIDSNDLTSKIQIIDSKFKLNNRVININSLVTDIGESRLQLSGLMHGWQKPTFYLEYKSSQLALSSIEEWLPSELKLTGMAKAKGRMRGSLDDPTIQTSLQLPVGSINGYQVIDLEFNLWYKNELLTFNDFKTEVAAGILTGRGTINWPKDEGVLYTASLEAEGIDLGQLSTISQADSTLTGQVNSNLVISGQNSLTDLSLFGSAQVTDGTLMQYEFDTLDSSFWFSNNQLLISDLNLKSDGSKWQAQGLIDDQRNLNLSITADDVKLSQLDGVHNYRDLAGTASLQGQVKGKLTDPEFSGEVQIKDASYAQRSVDEIIGVISYRQKRIGLNDVLINDQKRKYQLAGEIELAKEPKLDLELKTKAGKVASLYKLISDQPIYDIHGRFSGSLRIIGPINELRMAGRINLLKGQIHGIGLTSGSSSFSWENDTLKLESIQLFGVESQLIGSGRIEKNGGLALDLEAENIDLAKLELDNYDIIDSSTIQGSLDFTGEVRGDISRPVLAGEVKLNKLAVNRYNFQRVVGSVEYTGDKLDLRNLTAVQGATEYQAEGKLNLNKEKFSNLALELTNGQLNEVIELLPLKEVEHDIPHSFFGTMTINGEFEAPEVKGRLIAKDIDRNGYLLVDGSYDFGSGADLNVETQDFALAPFNQLVPALEAIGGDLNLTAELEGELEKLDIESTVEIIDGRVGTLKYDNLKGGLALTKGKLVKLTEPLKLRVNDDNLFRITGYLPLKNREASLYLNINLDNGNLNLLPLLVEGVKTAEGTGNFDLTVSGSRAEPDFAGEVEIDSGRLDIAGLAESISNLEGRAEIKDQRLKLKYLTGRQGQGQFKAQGSMGVTGWQPGQIDLDFSGERIVIDHGSWQGENDLDITVKGDITEPLISGSILVYDTKISLPFEWPTGKKDSDSAIKPNFDLNLEPGDNVRVQNDNIDILVESGSLQLVTIEDSIQLEGSVSSKIGSFNYYNTDFELESGSAIFDRYEGHIPYLNLTATTEVDNIQQSIEDKKQEEEDGEAIQNGSQEDAVNQVDAKEVLVTLKLSGLADQMEINLESNPSLSRQEIITLLAQQGGLQGFLTKDYDKMIRAEFFRMLESRIDVKILSNIEETVEDKWNLDRFRIYTGFNSGLKIKMGKSITDDLMLKYNQDFDEDKEHSLGFEYQIMDSMKDIILNGSLNNDEEYKLELETNFSFN